MLRLSWFDVQTGGNSKWFLQNGRGCLVAINTSKTYTNYTYIIPNPNSTKRHQYRVQYGASTRSEWKSGSGAYSFAVDRINKGSWVGSSKNGICWIYVWEYHRSLGNTKKHIYRKYLKIYILDLGLNLSPTTWDVWSYDPVLPTKMRFEGC